MPKLYFATDIHGSDICWKKFLGAAKYYNADILVLGGDMTGKAIVPLVKDPMGSTTGWLLGSEYILESQSATQEFADQVKSRGYYPISMTKDERNHYAQNPDALDTRFKQAIAETLELWLSWIDDRLAPHIPLVVCPGNDDPEEVDRVLTGCHRVMNGEGRFLDLGDFSLASTGWANPTPWKTYREETEPDLETRLRKMLPQTMNRKTTIFNFHCPPYASGLDDAPELGEDLSIKNAGQSTVPVGSTAVRKIIEEYQPLLSLHGHIHEAKGLCRIKKTVVVNPGSLYEQGILQGGLFDIHPKKGLRSWVLVSG